MRRALATAAALLLAAACRVDVEGAGCRVPGASEDCPSGQACGNDGRCSERAASCLAAGSFCLPDARKCQGGAIVTCAAGDGVCGAWTLRDAADDCAAAALACDPGQPACACASPDAEILVDGASPSGALSPTGASEPAECRFRRLGDALAYAKDVWLPGHPGASAIVRATGAPAEGAPVTFADETFPLDVAAGVTLASQTGVPGDWVIAATPPAGTDVVSLHGGGALEGFTLRAGAPATGHAISIACASELAATIHDVVVDGGDALARGISIAGACGVHATSLTVANVAGPGILVDPQLATASAPSVGARVDGGWIEDCAGSGIEVRGGALTLNQVVVRGNGGFGVSARTPDGARRAIALELNDSFLEDNGEAGLLVRALEPGSTVQVLRSWFRWNRASTAQATEFTSGRRAGGVYLYGTPPASLVFQGNKIYANANPGAGVVVDQLATVAGAAWDLSGAAACGALGNVLACPGSGALVYGSGIGPVIEHAYWPTAPAGIWPPVSLVTNADFDPTCPFDPAPIPECTP